MIKPKASHDTREHTHYGYVRCTTLKGYMDAMSVQVATHTGQDIQFEAFSTAPEYLWKLHRTIEVIYEDTKQWQGIPNRQDPISKSMIDFLRDKVADKDLHCLTNAIVDVAIMGVQTGWRVIEWSQPTRPKKAKGFYL